MKTIEPADGLVIRESVRLKPGVYPAPNGLRIEGDGVTLCGEGVVLVGSDRQGVGLTVKGNGCRVQGLRILEYEHGIRADKVAKLQLLANHVTGTAEIAPNTIFLDIWRTADEAYGAAVLLVDVDDSLVEKNDFQHQMNGILTYGCRNLNVRQNQCSYNSGFGIHLYDTCDSLFEENSVDYCCRFEPREGPRHFGHIGADATGFLVVYGSSRNRFLRNTARLGGDGFFVAGLTPKLEKRPCNDNLFEENDGSLSPNIAFECTFCSGNRFVDNYADRSNYGFWLGYSWDTQVEGNRMLMNRQAGIAVENGYGMRVRHNTFQGGGHGVLLWSRYDEGFLAAYPNAATCHDWQIEHYSFARNGVGIRIAADQDHGIRQAPGVRGRPESRPRNIALRHNDIQDNRVGIDLYCCDDILVESNLLNRNVESNLRQQDCDRITARNNTGSAGGYL
ncbi:MAG: right-handed parallel beta-helix repeat-containing protein [Fimbriimonadaceae bacterium]